MKPVEELGKTAGPVLFPLATHTSEGDEHVPLPFP